MQKPTGQENRNAAHGGITQGSQASVWNVKKRTGSRRVGLLLDQRWRARPVGACVRFVGRGLYCQRKPVHPPSLCHSPCSAGLVYHHAYESCSVARCKFRREPLRAADRGFDADRFLARCGAFVRRLPTRVRRLRGCALRRFGAILLLFLKHRQKKIVPPIARPPLPRCGRRATRPPTHRAPSTDRG